MNTFAFVGNLEDSPEVSCVYHSEQARARLRSRCLIIGWLLTAARRAQAENQYLRDPLAAVLGDGKQNRDGKSANRKFD